jgi:hypothetical protein
MVDPIALSRLRNNEHLQFQIEFRDLIEASLPIKSKIQKELDSHYTLYVQEDGCIKKIFKSETTEKRYEADKERDNTFSGLAGSIKADLKHSDPNVKESAYRLNILLETYGNLAKKPYQEETAGIYNLLSELKNEYASDVDTLNLKNWVEELEMKNEAFEKLVKARFIELEKITGLKTQDVRKEIDKVYRSIVARIEALMLIENDPIYETFARKLNAIISLYNNLIAQRKGRSDAKKNRKQRDDD